jgi:hypothetical protein
MRREGPDLRDVWYNACIIFGAIGHDVQYDGWTGLLTAVSFSENYLRTHLRGIGRLPHPNLNSQFQTIHLLEFDILDQKTPQDIATDMINKALKYK